MGSQYILESFSSFVSQVLENQNSLLEKEETGRPMSPDTAKEILEKVYQYNLDIMLSRLQNQYAGKTGDLKYKNKRKAVDLLREGESGKAFLYFFVGYDLSGNVIDKKRNRGLVEEFLKRISDNAPDGVFGKTGTDFYFREENGQQAKGNYANDLRGGINKVIESLSSEKANSIAKDLVGLITEEVEQSSGLLTYKRQFFWGFLSESEKDRIYEEFSTLAMKRGFPTDGPLLRMLEDAKEEALKENKAGIYSPGYSIYPEGETIEVKEEAKMGPPERTMILSDEEANAVFKPNKTGQNGDSDFQDETLEKIADRLSPIFGGTVSGDVQVKKIDIYSSADRYRNTGEAESMSWGQLAYARALTAASLVRSAAEKSGVSEELANQLNSITTLYFKGENGDGTSGPNPISDNRFGFYVQEGDGIKFMDGEDRETLVIIPIDDQGSPTKENKEGAKEEKKSPESSKEDYDQYRYLNIEIEYSKLQSDRPPASDSEKVIETDFPVKIRIPRRYKDREIKIPIPRISRSSFASNNRASGGSTCPDFKSGSRNLFQISFEPVTLAKWEVDLGK